MTTPDVSRETVQALAVLAGLSLDDSELDALLPLVEQNVETMAALDAIDLKDVEPAIIFRSEGN